MGHVGDNFTRLINHLIQLCHLDVQRFIDSLGLLEGELVLLHQLIDIHPIARGRGDATGGGVGLLQQTELLQIGHLITNGGGGHIQAGQLQNGFGAYRFGCLNVAFHHSAQNTFLALGQFHAGSSPLENA